MRSNSYLVSRFSFLLHVPVNPIFMRACLTVYRADGNIMLVPGLTLLRGWRTLFPFLPQELYGATCYAHTQ